MGSGARITDEVNFYRSRGDLKRAVRVVRSRPPERLRWRAAVDSMTSVAGALRGVQRLRVEEPVRELVLDLDDALLQRETVLDARRHGVDLDRGELLPLRTRWDLKRAAFLIGVDHELLGRYVALPEDFQHQIDTAGVVVVARALSGAHRKRAERLVARVGPERPLSELARHEHFMVERAKHDRELGRRWGALSKAILKPDTA